MSESAIATITAKYIEISKPTRGEITALVSELRLIFDGSCEEVELIRQMSDEEIQASITPSALISFVDGKSYKSLKRHLTKYGMTPNEYKTRFGLPKDYPMVAPNYSKLRSVLAKRSNFGTKA